MTGAVRRSDAEPTMSELPRSEPTVSEPTVSEPTVSEPTVSELTVSERYNGPAGVANGGYLAGVLAGRVEAAPGLLPTVTLLAPVPLATRLQVRSTGPRTGLWRGEELLATVRLRPATLEVAAAISVRAARAASLGFLGRENHPFPGCFACGPDRVDDGLRLAPGPVVDRTVACVWTPAGPAGVPVAAAIVWSALDCPGGWTCDPREQPGVLTQMTAEILHPVTTGTEYVIMAWRAGSHPRGSTNGSCLYAADGRLMARATAVWTRLIEPPHAPVFTSRESR